MSNIDLKPCPFCGGEASLMMFTRDHSSKDHKVSSFLVCCDSDGCRLSDPGRASSSFTLGKEEAIEQWNDQHLRRQNEKLREGLEFYADQSNWGEVNRIKEEVVLLGAKIGEEGFERAYQILEEVDNG